MGLLAKLNARWLGISIQQPGVAGGGVLYMNRDEAKLEAEAESQLRIHLPEKVTGSAVAIILMLLAGCCTPFEPAFKEVNEFCGCVLIHFSSLFLDSPKMLTF